MATLLTIVQNAVERINYRIEKLTDALGVNNPIVEEVRNQVDFFLGDNYFQRGDYMRISKPSEIMKDNEKLEALTKLDENIPTWRKVKEQFEPLYKETKEKTAFPEDVGSIETYIRVTTGLPNALATKYQQLDDNATMHIQGRRKTYEELAGVLDSI